MEKGPESTLNRIEQYAPGTFHTQPDTMPRDEAACTSEPDGAPETRPDSTRTELDGAVGVAVAEREPASAGLANMRVALSTRTRSKAPVRPVSSKRAGGRVSNASRGSKAETSKRRATCAADHAWDTRRCVQ